MRRIKKFGVFQTAKVAAIIYFFISLVIILPFLFIASMLGMGDLSGMAIGGVFYIILPFIYSIFAFIFTAIGCLVYNLVAGWTGGIEVELDSSSSLSDTGALDQNI